MRVIPLDLKEANFLVSKLHRHHKPVIGHRFSLGVIDSGGNLLGCAIASRPIARQADQKFTLEITRLATDGTKNACSFLLGAVARIARASGYAMVQTTTIESEGGASLKAVGWIPEEINSNGSWWDSRKSRNPDCKHEKKIRWRLIISDAPNVKKLELQKIEEIETLFNIKDTK